MPTQLRQQLRQYLTSLYPGARIVELEPLTLDTGATQKTASHGEPIRIVLIDGAGQRRELVWRTASASRFGHDRRADRVASVVQAHDDFAAVPGQIAAIDYGFVRRGGELQSCRDAGEPYLITSFAPGTIYASDLRRIASQRTTRELDRARLAVLVHYLAELHVAIADAAEVRYRRAIRDLIGSGGGIFGIIDGYPDELRDERLYRLEVLCASWRWRLTDSHARLTRTHGDFHPFNVVFDGATRTTLSLLDASRGACGDPADDVTAMAINFLLFAIDEPAAWADGLGVLWRQWWAGYQAARPDPGLLAAAPPFWAWRTLVVCNPRFYPQLSAAGRDRLLGFAERVLTAGTLEPAWAEELFT